MIQGINDDREVYLNGEFLPLSQAKISVLDRGFIFGDGIYEVVPAYKGKPFRLDEHVARLMRSLSKIKLETGKTAEDWKALMKAMIDRSDYENTFVYLQVTRGVAKRDHAFPRPAVAPTIFMIASPFDRPSEHYREDGLRTVSMEDVRWLHCDIKSVSLLGNVLAKEYALEREVDDVIQFRDGYLSEASSANIWVVKGGKLLAPVRDNLILEGIRYGFIEELAKKVGVPFEARKISKEEVAQADEIMFTSATKEILPITEHDGKAVNGGKPGPVYRQLRQAYDEVIEQL
ncbi:D-amino acid aminotransferase [Basilea psittacipulmonis]|uniref:Cytochrome C550 n=1 Tax=Basilea psittacipulmonis DSM 24701 TaxID=1072685 RepID=A0A077DFQ4_9BURK|nr:D-amino acid aminotransferase [Basilea psittacipulmonis]AIL32003.1 cytochrome C550 [Basilea psittacipulmonis DSM 24701]